MIACASKIFAGQNASFLFLSSVTANLTMGGDCFEHSMRAAKKALRSGKSDDEIGAAFEEGLEKDFISGLAFYATDKEERPTRADLYARLDADDKDRVRELLGTKAVVGMISGKRNYPDDR